MSSFNWAYVGDTAVHALNCITTGRDGYILSMSFVEQYRIQAKSIAARVNNGAPLRIDGGTFYTKGQRYATLMKPISRGRETVILMTLMNMDIGKRYLLTEAEHLDADFHSFLMNNYHLPLLEEWTPFIRENLVNESNISHPISRTSFLVRTEGREDAKETGILGIEIHGKNRNPDDILVYDFENLSEGMLRDVVSSLIRDGVIKVADVPSKPLEFKGFDEYITRYGTSLVENLEQTIDTLSPLKGDVDGFVAKTKRLYPQQAACINGITALKRAGSNYGIMCEGMGCGKTLQGAAVVEAYFNQKWLKSHPGKTLQDLFLSADKPTYRNILMAPSHLVNKWKEEVEGEIPGATCTILSDLSQLEELRRNGKERKGKEWYLISKDFAKLGSLVAPVPTRVKHMVPKAPICADCHEAEERPMVVYKTGADKCVRCGGNRWKQQDMKRFGKVRGLVCPECDNLLIRYSAKYFETGSDKPPVALLPQDFASRNKLNMTCFTCGTSLWEVDCKNLGTQKPSKWYKVTHWKNYQHKGTDSVFVLKGHENEYYAFKGVEAEGIKVSAEKPKPRKVAPAQFIKKYLKGYFDFCVLDEAHKYEGGGTAQATAAHALMGASGFTLCLTGTLSNGRADSFFYLLYMLHPSRMKERGFGYSDVMEFSKRYGSVETAYEAGYEDEGRRNAMSRGRVLHQPKVKPGISPLLFTDFLLDKAVFLDLSDLSQHLPPLYEHVVPCECPDDVAHEVNYTLSTLKEAMRQKGGKALMSNMLQFGLSYPDKPYGVAPIMHPKFQDMIVAAPKSFNHYADGQLLPKEEKLIELVRKEIAENRNVFVYCAYTGSAEKNVLERLKYLVEENCNLAGQVCVMRAETPKAVDREAYIKKMAVTEGVRCFICNMKLVETGLDFCGKYEGFGFNFPTIIFYQMTYELSVMWQASRRHFRLNQTEECRTYYLCTEGTLQMAALSIMAEKQVAASAIQGKFSADGLAAMANGIDPRLKLAQMLSENDMSDRKSLENMFDALNTQGDGDERYGAYEPPMTYYELMADTVEEASIVEVKPVETKTQESVKEEGTGIFDQASLFEVFDLFNSVETTSEPTIKPAPEPVKPEKATSGKTKRRKKPVMDQHSLFDMFAA